MFAAADDELSVARLLYGDSCVLIATFVAPVDGNEIVAAAAVYSYLNDCIVAYHKGAGTEAVRSNGGQSKHVGLRGDDGASHAQ